MKKGFLTAWGIALGAVVLLGGCGAQTGTPSADATSVTTVGTTASSALPQTTSTTVAPTTTASTTAAPITKKPTAAPATKTTATAPTTTAAVKKGEVGQKKEKGDFTVKLLSMNTADGVCTAEFEVTCAQTALEDHELLPKERIWLVDASKHRCGIRTAVDQSGASLLGKTLARGKTQYIKAEFALESGFEPTVFQYVFDTRGFRDVRFELN